MRIGLQTWGSEGDIRPFFALAEGLQKAGHNVTLVVTSAEDKDYTSLAEYFRTENPTGEISLFLIGKDADERK